MKCKKKFNSLPLVSTVFILILVFILSTAPAATAQNASPMKTYAYITNSGDNTVSVIDTATNTVITTVNVGSSPLGVVVSPDGKKVYVTNEGSNNLSVIDTATHTVIATVNVGRNPYGAAVTPDGSNLYVANFWSHNVSVIDTATNTVKATVFGGYPYGVAVSPDGKKVYVGNGGPHASMSSQIHVIDTATNTDAGWINMVGQNPQGVAVSPDGKKVYTGNFFGNSVSVIDTTTNTVTGTIKVGSYPTEIAVTPDGKKVYVANRESNDISVIDATTDTVTSTVNVGSRPRGLSVTPDGTKVYVANSGSGTISVIDTSTNTVTDTVLAGQGPVAFGQFIGSIPELEPTLPTLPVANFSINITNGYAPLSVQFMNLSENATELNWDFENDGNTDSTEASPVHIYSVPGIYTVNLTATNDNGTNSKLATITVLEQTLPPVANFNSNVTQGYAPLTVQFTDLSENATEWKWDFGDRTYSTDKDPVHTYSKAGRYTISLTVKNANGMDMEIKSKCISVSSSKGKKN